MISLLDIYIQRALPMCFDDSVTQLELMGRIVAKVNELIEADNAYFNTDVRTNLKAILTEWQTDGTLQIVINEAITSRVDTLEATLIASKKLNGKKVVVIGDSVALGVSSAPEIVTLNTWPNRFRDITGCTLDNRAVSGTCMATIGDSGRDVNAGCAIVDTAVLTGADYVVIAYGINDYMHNVPIGKPNNDKTTFRGALSYMLGKINTVAPSAKIVCLTPLYGGGHATKNSVGYIPGDYSDAIMSTATAYNVPTIDMTHRFSTTDYNYGYLYFDGQYHPTEATYIKMGEYIAMAFDGEAGHPARPLMYRYENALTGATNGETPPAIAIDTNEFVHMRGLITANASNIVSSIHLNELARPAYDLTLPLVTLDKVSTWVRITAAGEMYFGVGGASYDLAGIVPWHCGMPNVI